MTKAAKMVKTKEANSKAVKKVTQKVIKAKVTDPQALQMDLEMARVKDLAAKMEAKVLESWLCQ